MISHGFELKGARLAGKPPLPKVQSSGVADPSTKAARPFQKAWGWTVPALPAVSITMSADQPPQRRPNPPPTN